MADILALFRKRKRSSRVVLGAALLAALFGLGLGTSAALFALNRPTGVGRMDVTVPPGAGVVRIANMLHEEGVIRSPRFLRFLSVATGASTRLTAGVHPFHGGMTAWQVLQELQVPRDITKDVTIPEGLRKEAIAGLLADSLGLNRDSLLAIVIDAAFCRRIGVEADDLEGYLFPETYRFSLAMNERQVITLMVDHFFRAFDDRLKDAARKLGMSVHEAATMASIIEGEAQVSGERDTISAVYHNRLKKGMRLQADPTVQFALPGPPRRLFYKDYQYDSPYNTYRVAGLPPGPIASAGRASLRAAVSPADVDYLYFVARGDGSHVFSRTAAEHEAAKRRTLSARRKTWQRR